MTTKNGRRRNAQSAGRRATKYGTAQQDRTTTTKDRLPTDTYVRLKRRTSHLDVASTNTNGMPFLTSTQSSSKVKAGALWPKSKDELVKQLAELKTELSQLRIQKITSSGSKLNRM